MHIPAHLRPLAKQARAKGWVITPTGSGHLRWRPPSGGPVFSSSTPKRSGHAARNEMHRLERAVSAARAA